VEKELIELKRKEIELMEEQLSQEQSVNLEELVISHSYEMLALITVLEKKGILTRAEIIEVIKELKKSCP
jgi:branched-subunit amino acid aminotransferase/4-amino-4-deoxychorismate lyase